MTSGPLVMILLDTGGNVTLSEQDQLADSLAAVLNRLSFFNAKVGLITSSNGAKVAFPAVDLNEPVSTISTNGNSTFITPGSFNWNVSLGEYESYYYNQATSTQIQSISTPPIRVGPTQFTLNCPTRNSDNLRIHYLNYDEDNSNELGYNIIGKACVPNDNYFGPNNPLSSPSNQASQIYYRFTNIPLNRGATIGSIELEISIACLIINANGINTQAHLSDMELSLMRLRLCNSDPTVSPRPNRDQLNNMRSSASLPTPNVNVTCPDSLAGLPQGSIRRLCRQLRPLLAKVGIDQYRFRIEVEVTDDSQEYLSSSDRPENRVFSPSFQTIVNPGDLVFNRSSDEVTDTVTMALNPSLFQGIINRTSYCGSEDRGITLRVTPEYVGTPFAFGTTGPDDNGGDPNPNPNVDGNSSTDPMAGGNINRNTNRFMDNATLETRRANLDAGSAPRFPRPIAVAKVALTNKARLRFNLANNAIPSSGSITGCLERKQVFYSTGANSWSYGMVNSGYANRVTLPNSRYMNRDLYQPGEFSCEAQPSAPLSDVINNNTRDYNIDMFIGKRGAIVLNFPQVTLPIGVNVSRAFITLSSPVLSRNSSDATRATNVDPFDLNNPQTPPYDYSYNNPVTYQADSSVSSLRIFMNAPNDTSTAISALYREPLGLSSNPNRFTYPLNGDQSPSYLYKFESEGSGIVPSTRDVASICGTNHLADDGTVGNAVNWNLGTWRYTYSQLPGNNPIQNDTSFLNVYRAPSYQLYDSPDLSNQVNDMISMNVNGITWQPNNSMSFVLQNRNTLLNSSNYTSYQCPPPARTCNSLVPRLIGFGGGNSSTAFGSLPQPRLTLYYHCVLSATESCQTVREHIPSYVRTQIQPFGRWVLQAQLFELISYIRGDEVHYGHRRAANSLNPTSSAQSTRMHASQTSNFQAANLDTTSNDSATSGGVLSPASCGAWDLADDTCFDTAGFQRFTSGTVRYESPFDGNGLFECDRRILLIIGKAENWPEISVTRTENSATTRNGARASARQPYYFSYCNPFLFAGRGFYRDTAGAQPTNLNRIDQELSCLNPITFTTGNSVFNNRLNSWRLTSNNECVDPTQALRPLGVNPVVFNLDADNSNYPAFVATASVPSQPITESSVVYDSLNASRVQGSGTIPALNLIQSSNARGYAQSTYCIFEMVRGLINGDNRGEFLSTRASNPIGQFSVHTFLLGPTPDIGIVQRGFWHSGRNASQQAPNFLTQAGAANAVMTGITQISSGNSGLNPSGYFINDWINNSLDAIFLNQSSFTSPTIALTSFSRFSIFTVLLCLTIRSRKR